MKNAIPIACTLTDKQMQARRADHLEKAAAALIDSTELENGFVFRFPLSSSVLRDLTQIIDLERRCCPFLNFKLSLGSGDDFLSLEMTGADGTKELIGSLFRWN